MTSPHQYIASNPNTLLTRFYGMYSMRQVCCLVITTTTSPRKRHSESNVRADRLLQGKNSEINFVVMENVFHPEVPIDEQYDLKVSLSSLCAPAIFWCARPIQNVALH